MPRIIGVDSGGTFTDTVVIDEDGRLNFDKALTTSHDISEGVLNSVRNAADDIGIPLDSLLKDALLFAHGTTAAINKLVSRTGSKVGLITTKGHEDAILVGRIHQKIAGLVEKEITHAANLDKAAPLVPRPLIKGITERIDYKGTIIVKLNEDEVVEAIEALLREGVEAIAVSFLWSFINPAHEKRVKEIILQRAPHLFVTISCELVPMMNEYERTATTVINAYLGSTIVDYVNTLNLKLKIQGLAGPLLLMQSMGGCIPAEEASDKAVNILSSGPVGGVIGSLEMGKMIGYQDIITTDVGGTSFDVGLVVGGKPLFASAPVFEKYHVLIPMVDIVSIGAGGGSIAYIEPETNILRVGPKSAGANPGPACYGFGGTEPTVTDADVVLGRINPDYFLGGRMRIHKDRALKAIKERIADPLEMSPFEAAKGILDIIDGHMADLVRRVTIEQGHDPRNFVLFAYGGNGPTHVGAYGADLGVKTAIISPLAPVFSAFGIAGADILRNYVRSHPMAMPFDVDGINEIFAELSQRAEEDLHQVGVERNTVDVSMYIDFKYKRQTHTVTVRVPRLPLTHKDLEKMVDSFEEMYEQVYGKGTAYREAGVELTNFRVTSTTFLPKPRIPKSAGGGRNSDSAFKGYREVYFGKQFAKAGTYDQNRLLPENAVEGPAVIEDSATTIPIHPGQWVEVDPYHNLILHLG